MDNKLLYEAGVHYSQKPVVGMRQYKYGALSPNKERVADQTVWVDNAHAFVLLLQHWNRADWIYFPVSE